MSDSVKKEFPLISVLIEEIIIVYGTILLSLKRESEAIESL